MGRRGQDRTGSPSRGGGDGDKIVDGKLSFLQARGRMTDSVCFRSLSLREQILEEEKREKYSHVQNKAEIQNHLSVQVDPKPLSADGAVLIPQSLL
jgi:hypothetical protein